MKTTIAYDRNGNKIVKIKIGNFRAFSIQTLDLPLTHRNGPDLLEIRNWIRNHGTERQKEILEKM